MANKVNIAGASSGNNVKLDNVVLDVFTKEILFTAQPVLRFESVAVKKSDLQATAGNTIKFLKYDALTGDSAIAETTDIETDTLSTSVKSISVGEHAKAIAVREFLLQSSMTDVMQDASVQLGRHYAKSRDSLCRNALLTSPNVLYGGGVANRAALTTAKVFDISLIRDVVEALAVNKAPKFGGDAYICFVHPHQGRQLRDTAGWLNIQQYASPENLLSGEIGRIEDVRFVETTQITKIPANTQNIFADGADTGADTAVAANANTDVYQAIVVGDYALGLAEALPVEMRDNGVQDFGRKHSLAYYGIWGAGLIETGHVFVLETA